MLESTIKGGIFLVIIELDSQIDLTYNEYQQKFWEVKAADMMLATSLIEC